MLDDGAANVTATDGPKNGQGSSMGVGMNRRQADAAHERLAHRRRAPNHRIAPALRMATVKRTLTVAGPRQDALGEGRTVWKSSVETAKVRNLENAIERREALSGVQES
jgi:hypothetical protein